MTRASALRQLRHAFDAAGLAEPGPDARLIVLQALGVSAAELAARPDVALDGSERRRLSLLARRRLAGEPVGRILGSREFWGLPFRLAPETLEPRDDSETLVRTALDLAGDRAAARTILDLGTGSGCLLVALLWEWTSARGLGVDRSPGALAMARCNAAASAVSERAWFVAADWGATLAGRFDVIVSNPPYIATADLALLEVEVREHDPHLALDGGSDGLAAYRAVLPEAARLLAPGGLVAVEIGQGQEEPVARIGRAAGLELRRVAADLSGIVRVLAFARREDGGGAVGAPEAPEKKSLGETGGSGLE